MPIIKMLMAFGAEVWRISGKGLPDLLVCYRGRYFVGEVKTAKGRETKHQGRFPIWRTPTDALVAIGAVRPTSQ